MSFSKFRKLDYILFYIITSVIFIIQLTKLEASLVIGILIGILIGATIPSLILGTITNFIFKNK